MVLILECDHMFQTERIDPNATAPSWDSSEVQRKQKSLFRRKIQQLLDKDPCISLMAEEAAEGQCTTAADVAANRGIRYANINLFKRQQKELGFPKNYLSLPQAEQAPYHRIREQHFLDQTMTNLPPEGDVLFICGSIHADRMKALFEQNGYAAAVLRLTSAEGFNWEWFIEPFEGF